MRFALPATALLIAAPLLSACTQNAQTPASGSSDSGTTDTVTVTSRDDACELSTTEAPAGTLHFEVSNAGSEVTEFYLYKADGTSIVGEKENIGPGLSATLTISAQPGTYTTACKPGMTGDGIRAKFTVTGDASDGATTSSESADPDESDTETDGADPSAGLVDKAQDQYAVYVRAQSDLLLSRTQEFLAAYTSGNDNLARRLYPVAREPWERIEPVAESFGTLDPKMDAREADLADGQQWTGWHRLEKDLWPARAGKYEDLSRTERKQYAADLLADTRELHSRIQTMTFTTDQIANGSSSLMEEVATGKVTGEEEYWSRTDLYDFQANLDGSEKGYELVRPILMQRDPALGKTLDRRFADLQRALSAHRDGDGFVSYDELTKAQVKSLADAVNALSEPLSHLTAAVLP